MKKTASALGLCVTAALLAGCGGGASSSTDKNGDGDQVVEGATFTMALSADLRGTWTRSLRPRARCSP